MMICRRTLNNISTVPAESRVRDVDGWPLRTNPAFNGVCRHYVGAVAAIPAAERQVLLDLYSATNGADWRHASSTARWQRMRVGGVTCDAGQTTVLEINLSVRNPLARCPRQSISSVTCAVSIVDGNW